MAKASIWNPLFYRNSALAELIVESAAEGVWVIGLDGLTLYANPAMLRLLDVSPEHLLASHAFDFVPIEDRAQTRTEFEKCLHGSRDCFDCRLLRRDGKSLWARITTTLFHDEAGHPVGLLGYVSDITEQRTTAAALLQAEDRLRLAVDAAELGTFNCDYPLETGTFVWSPTVLRQHYLTPDETPTLSLFLSRLHPDDRDVILRALDAAARHHASYDVEYRIVSPPPFSGHNRWIRAMGRHCYDEAGNPLRIDGITIDITDRKLLEGALREEGRATQTLYALSKTLVTEFDLETLVHTITEAGRVLTAASLGAFFHRVQEDEGDSCLLYSLSGNAGQRGDGMPVPCPTELFGPAYLAKGPVRIGDMDIEPRIQADLLHVIAREEHPLRSFLAVPVVSRFGHIIGAICCGHPEAYRFTDRDERTLAGIASHAAIALDNARLLNEARQANAAKDKFLAVLSHELRTPLNPVLLTAGMMATDASLPASVRANCETIRRNVELEARLIDDLLDLTRIAKGRIDLRQGTVDVHTLLQNVAAMFKEELAAKHLGLTLDLAAPRHHVRGDHARLQQVWWNLLRNAIKFTGPQGAITIATRNTPAPGDPNLSLLTVDITDTGIGINPDQIDRLFRPFEQADGTISRRFGGLGLGLAISRSLMEIHKGTLTAASEGPNRGTTFTACLPVVPAHEPLPGDSSPRPATASDGRTASLRILLVEDHIDTARTMARLLTTLGHTPMVAHSLAGALQASAEHAFDLLICDIGLPDGSGLDLLPLIPHGRCPSHCVALTGYGMEQDIQRTRAAGFEEHFIKPLDFERLLGLLQKVAGPAGHCAANDPPASYQI